MTYEQYSPEWLIEHCDNEIAFERAVRRQMSRLLAENADYGATIDHLTRETAEQIGEIVALKEQRDELIGVLHLALEYWAHREQRYKNRSPVWVQKSREAIAKVGGAA